MFNNSNMLVKLIDKLKLLPGIGAKNASRLAIYMLKNKPVLQQLIDCLSEANQGIRQCKYCRVFSIDEICSVCRDPNRANILCIVCDVTDMFKIEATKAYQGKYFVTYGCISPVDNLGPEDIGINALEDNLATQDIKEIILSLPFTQEGIATSYLIEELAQKYAVPLTSLRCGMPFNANMDYIDSRTLKYALEQREKLDLSL